MAWKNVIVGYKIITLKQEDAIPADAQFLTTSKEAGGVHGYVSNPRVWYYTLYHYQVPVYKKKNIKKINSEQGAQVSDTT
jgi:hypothetical protein